MLTDKGQFDTSKYHCRYCKEQIPGYHKKGCTYWGTILPSECDNLIADVLAEVLNKQNTSNRANSSTVRAEHS